MTDIKFQSSYGRFQTVFAFCVLFALVGAMFAGAALPGSESCMILPVSPFKNGSALSDAVRICFPDVVLFWVLTVPLSRGVTVAASTFVFFYRGLVLGCAFRMLVANSVTWVSAALLASYALVTLLALFYDAFLNGMGERGGICRFASCLVATGAAAVLKLFPLLLLT